MAPKAAQLTGEDKILNSNITPKHKFNFMLFQELRFYMKNSNVAIHQLKSQLGDYDEVLLQDNHNLTPADAMKLREIKLKIIWAEKPNVMESLNPKPQILNPKS